MPTSFMELDEAHMHALASVQKCVTTVLKAGLATPLYPPLIYSLLYILSFFSLWKMKRIEIIRE